MSYVSVFEEKQCVKFDGWVGDNFGEVACFGVVMLDFNVVRYDVNVGAPKGAYVDWYEKFCGHLGVSYPNYLKMKYNIKRYYYFEDFEDE